MTITEVIARLEEAKVLLGDDIEVYAISNKEGFAFPIDFVYRNRNHVYLQYKESNTI